MTRTCDRSYILIILIIVSLEFIGTMKVKSEEDGMLYLSRYGYMEDDRVDKASGMRIFQRFAGVKETGKLDIETMKLMGKPRCGNKERMDIHKNADINIQMTNANWRFTNVREIPYKINNFPKSGLSSQIIRQTVRKAFDLWEQFADIKCTEITNHHQISHDEDLIEISFQIGNHGDSVPFGATEIGEAVAHAFFFSKNDNSHQLEGDIHFDNERGWTVETVDGINFFQICVHEIGHVLGLEHSMVKGSVMSMLVRSHFDPQFGLHEDDIKGIQNLYGPKTTTSSQDDEYYSDLDDSSQSESNFEIDRPQSSRLLNLKPTEKQQSTLPLQYHFYYLHF